MPISDVDEIDQQLASADAPPYLSVRRTAALLDRSRHFVYQQVREGRLPAVRTSTKCGMSGILISRRALAEFLAGMTRN